MDYSKFLFVQLLQAHDILTDIPYDIVWENYQVPYEEFISSPYNSDEDSEYDCMEDFIIDCKPCIINDMNKGC